MRPALVLSLLFVTAGLGHTAEPLVSGLAPGQRPGPYSSLVAVGPQRGQMHCFICENVDRPAVVVFARKTSDPLGKFVRGLDQGLLERKAVDFRAWVTFLHDDQTSYDGEVVRWAKTQAVRGVPLAVFESVVGPPAYKLHRDAEVSVLFFTKQKIVHNFTFRAGEFTDERVAELLKLVDEIAPLDKK